MSYKTYAEAKIANPDSEIVTTGKNWGGTGFLIGTFEIKSEEHYLGDSSWVICNPADYCSSIKEFLEAGFKFSVDDIYISTDGSASSIDEIYNVTNNVHSNDAERYILSAAALNGGCKIPAKDEWTIYNNDKPICDLSYEQRCQLFNAWVKGEVRQRFKGGKFIDMAIDECNWHVGVVYRIKQISERELLIQVAEKIIDDSRCFNDDRATAMAAVCCIINTGKFKLVKDAE